MDLMDGRIVWVICLMIGVVLLIGWIDDVYGDKLEVMGIAHKDNPMVCIMEPEPIMQFRFYNNDLELTNQAIDEWSNEMFNYTNGLKFHSATGWVIEKQVVLFPDHYNKLVTDFPQCNIFIEFDTHNMGQHIPNQKALGYTQIDFSKSKHQWAFIMIYLESIEVGQKFSFCIGCEDETPKTIDIDMTPKPIMNDALLNIIKHELGHALGVGHYIQDTVGGKLESLMYPQIDPFKEYPDIGIPIADREAMRIIYGDDGFGGIQGLTKDDLSVFELLDGILNLINEKLY